MGYPGLRRQLAALVLLVLASVSLAGEELTPRLSARLGLADLKVDTGKMTEAPSGRLVIESNKVRATARPIGSGSEAELLFAYVGPTKKTFELSSGMTVRQIGIKLRAADTCNVVYVMWRQEPKEEILVSIKRNPGDVTTADCEARGYTTLGVIDVGRLGPRVKSSKDGAEHALRAVLRDRETGEGALTVWADGVPVWEGRVPVELLKDLKGSVGLRADNGRYQLRLSREGG
jgi:hypothetical protein